MNELELVQRFDEEEEENEVDLQIAMETNNHINEITEDIGLLPNLFHTIQHLIWSQEIDIKTVSNNVEESKHLTNEGVVNLEMSEKHLDKSKKVRDAGIIFGGAAIGGIGWIGGPWIGIPTTGLGIGISSGVVFIMNKFSM